MEVWHDWPTDLFYNLDNKTHYVSDEFNGDKAEMESADGTDSCDKDWEEILCELEEVRTLLDYLQAISRITGYYHLNQPNALPGTRIHVYHTKDELEIKDETYAIYSDRSGAFLDLDLSSCVEK